MTPKSLLRHPLAASPVADLAGPGFQPGARRPVFEAGGRRGDVRRVVLCSGKVWADLAAERRAGPGRGTLAVARLEELYPFPRPTCAPLLDAYPRAGGRGLAPGGAAEHGRLDVRRRPDCATLLAPRGLALRYVGRPERASPAEGWSGAHAAEQGDRRRRDAGLDAPTGGRRDAVAQERGAQ